MNVVLKNRRGELKTLFLLWQPEYTSFVTLDKRREDE